MHQHCESFDKLQLTPNPATVPAQSKLVLCLQRDAYYPIYEQLFPYLDTIDLILLSRTCKDLSGLYRDQVSRQWNINERLAGFVEDPLRFRSVMATQNVLLSGECALRFMDRRSWDDVELDTFVEHGPAARAFLELLIKREGYSGWIDTAGPPHKLHEFLSSTSASREILQVGFTESLFGVIELLIAALDQTYRYRKQNKVAGAPLLRIRVIITKHEPITAILKVYYSTCLVNVISWNKAYAVFPIPTFVHHTTLYLMEPGSKTHACADATLAAMGWSALKDLPREETPAHMITGEASADYQVRRVGDECSWIITLDTAGMNSTQSTSDGVNEYAQFHLTKEDHYEKQIRFYTLRSDRNISHALLRNVYVGSEVSWVIFVKVMLSKIECDKASESSEGHKYGVCGCAWEALSSQKTAKPWHGLIYCDDEIPRWYEEWLAAEWKEDESGSVDETN